MNSSVWAKFLYAMDVAFHRECWRCRAKLRDFPEAEDYVSDWMCRSLAHEFALGSADMFPGVVEYRHGMRGKPDNERPERWI